jgi:crotonobetainyl-CoA:carnitine CoA-transferase CaiB-like acyl-CoA transferase
MMEDPHFQARGLFQQVEINGKPLKVPAITPRLADTPGKTRWPGGEVGSHNHSVLRDELGLSDAEFAELQAQGIIG